MNKHQAVALYARVSSSHQAQERTIESQVAALKDYATSHHYSVEEDLIFCDAGVSGSTLERPALDGLRDHAVNGMIDTVLILCPDRLARKHAHQLLLVEEFSRLGVDIVFINRPLSDSPEDQLLLQIQGIMAEYEREKMMERSRRGKLYKAQSGQVSVLSGAPYGYAYVSKTETQEARYEILEDEAQVVREIFREYVVGKKSIGAIARRLTEEGVKSRRDVGHWERSVVWAILRNPAYMGQAAFRKTRVVARNKATKQARDRNYYPKHTHSSVRDRPSEEWITIPVPAIIPEAWFHRAEEQLQENKKLSPRNNKKYEYLLSGLIHCQRCGYAIYGKPASNSKYKRRYYRCMGQDGCRWPKGRICDGHPVRVEVLDELVWQQIQRLLQEPELVLNEYAQRQKSKQKQRASLEEIAVKKQKELREQQHQKERLLDLYQNGIVSLQEMEPRLQKIRKKMADIQQECDLLEREKAQQLKQFQVIEQFEVFKERLGLKLGELSFEQKKALVRLLVSEVILDSKEATLIVKHTLPINPPQSPQSNGNKGNPEAKNPEQTLILDSSAKLEPSWNEEALKKSFPLCKGRNDTPLRGSLNSLYLTSILLNSWGFQPSLDIKKRPSTRRMMTNGFQHELMVNCVKGSLNIKLQDPVVLPTPFLRHRHGLQRGLAGTIRIGIGMKIRLDFRFQAMSYHRLGNAIRYRGNAQKSRLAILFRDFDRPDSRRKVTSR